MGRRHTQGFCEIALIMHRIAPDVNLFYRMVIIGELFRNEHEMRVSLCARRVDID